MQRVAADVAAQVAQQLRSGTYRFTDDSSSVAPPAFARVALVGHSQGHIVEVAAYTFGDVFDAFVFVGWSQSLVTTRFAPLFTAIAASGVRCSVAPQQKRPGAQGGYDLAFSKPTEPGVVDDHVMDALFFDVDPAVKAAYTAAVERDPCGIISNLAKVMATSATALSEVRDPVLVVLGDHDLFTSPDMYASRFSGSSDVSTRVIPGAGHMVMLERAAPEFRAELSDWLTTRGF